MLSYAKLKKGTQMPDRGQRAGVPTDMADKLKALERENRELLQANEILRNKASANFATAELDRRYKP